MQLKCIAWTFVLTAALSCLPAGAADWERQGGDPGMSKYSPHNIPADASWKQLYRKRFYGRPTGGGNYSYAYAVPTHAGRAVVLSDDRPNLPPSTYMVGTIFDWKTGVTQTNWTDYYSLVWEIGAETDTHHYTNPIVWHSDGRIYSRRGGDNPATCVYEPAIQRLTKIHGRDAQGLSQTAGVNNVAVMQTYKDLLICRYGDMGALREFTAGSIAEVCFVEPNILRDHPDILGRRVAGLGPLLSDTPDAEGFTRSVGSYGDVPKAVNDVCVLASLAFNVRDSEGWPYNTYLYLQATDLLTDTRLWTRTWVSDAGGSFGFAAIQDYWRFVASDTGHYVCFTRGRGQPTTIRALDLRTGQEKWNRVLTDPDERPLMACHGGFLYVIGRAEQFKLTIDTNQVIWRTTHSFPNDRGYVTAEPIYRPMVLTDDTLWFVDGDNSSSPTMATLVGMRTTDGEVIRRFNLASLYPGLPGESLRVVHDLVLADGLVGVLVGVTNTDISSRSTTPYQDLYVYQPMPAADPNGDGKVDLQDLMQLAAAFGTFQAEPAFDPAVDFNADAAVDVVDLLILVEHFGQGT